MKKILSVLLSLLTVLSLLSPAAVSYGAESISIGKYGTGAETWLQKSNGATMHHTQFLLTMSESDWNRITAGSGITFTGTAYDAETGKWTTGGITGGRFELEITDYDGKTRNIVCPPTTETGSGTKIVRFETADFGEPKFQIRYGDSYTVRLRVYVGSSNTPAFESNAVKNLYWEKGNASTGCDKMYVGGKPLEVLPEYTPADDPYEKPVSVKYCHYYLAYDFEDHDVHGRNLLLGIPLQSIPVGGNTGANRLVGSNVKITYPDGSAVNTSAVSSFSSTGYNDAGESNVNCFFIRIPVSPFPAEGDYPGCKVEIFRRADGKKMMTGEIDLRSGGNHQDISDLFDVYGTGAETWANHSGAPEYKAGSEYSVTQFLVTVPKTFHEQLIEKLTFTPSKRENGVFTPAVWEGGHFELEIFDYYEEDGEPTKLSLNPATVGGSGDRSIYRFETCEAGFQIHKGRVYGINLRIYIGDTCAYEGEIPILYWSGEGEIYCGGKRVKAVPYDYYHYSATGADFEDHPTLGKNLLLGIPLDRLPDAQTLLPNGTRTVVKADGRTYETRIASNFGVQSGTVSGIPLSVDCYFVRIDFPNFPRQGAWDSEIAFYDAGGGKIYEGTVMLVSEGGDDPGPGPGDKTNVTLSSCGGSSDFRMYNGKQLLFVNVHGIRDLQDLKYFATSVTVTLDGTTLAGNRLVSSEDGSAEPGGGYQALLRLDAGAVARGKHTVQITITGGETDYRSDTLEVTCAPEGRLGDMNGDGKVNGGDRNYLARALANWKNYPLPDAGTGDFTGDGKVNGSDRTYLARALAGWSGYALPGA